MKYKVSATEVGFPATVDIEAESEDEANAIYHAKWLAGELPCENGDLEITVEPDGKSE